MTACRSNEKNIATALEMYSADNGGRFPSTLALLVPRYLKNLPSCPAAASVTYAYVASPEPTSRQLTADAPSVYTVVCAGHFHEDVAMHENYPQYTSTQGLLER